MTDGRILLVLFISLPPSCWPAPAHHGTIKRSAGRPEPVPITAESNNPSIHITVVPASTHSKSLRIFSSEKYWPMLWMHMFNIQSANTRSSSARLLSSQTVLIHCLRHSDYTRHLQTHLSIHTSARWQTINENNNRSRYCLTLFRHVILWPRSSIESFPLLWDRRQHFWRSWCLLSLEGSIWVNIVYTFDEWIHVQSSVLFI